MPNFENLTQGSTSFLFETPISFGINFQELGGFSTGLPFIGDSSSFTDALESIGDSIGNAIDSFLPNEIGRFAGLPLSLLVVDSYMSEEHFSQSVITNDPVESGPNITSHSYPRPTTVKIDFVINDFFLSQFSIGGEVLSNAPFIGAVNRTSLAYSVLDSLRRSSIPVFLTTRTWVYPSMLISSISIKRDIHYYTRAYFSVKLVELYQAHIDYSSVADTPNNRSAEFSSIVSSGVKQLIGSFF